MAGFQAVDAGVAIKQQVAVRLLDIIVFKRFNRINRIIFGEIIDDCAGQNHQIVHGGEVVFARQAGAVEKMRAAHAQALGFGIHHIGEALFTAADGLSQRDGRIVARLYNQAFNQIAYAGRLARLQKHARALGFPAFFRHGEHLVGLERAVVERFEGEISRHQLGERSRLHRRIQIFAGQHLAALQIFYHKSRGGNLRRLRQCSGRACR